MKKLMCMLVAAMALGGCVQPEATQQASVYVNITAQEAKQIMDTETGYIILDTRAQDEYDAGHIPDAVLLPVGSITKETASAVIPEKDAVVLVYCRSGNRSKTAAKALAELDYTNIYEFGGINAWPYEVVR